MGSLLILLIILLVPVMIPNFGLGYEQIKVFGFLILISILAIAWLYSNLKEPKKYRIKNTNLKIASIIFVLILGIGSLLGIDPPGSITGRPPYFQGLITYAYLVLFSILISVFKPTLLNISKSLTLSSFLVSLLALKDFLFLNLLHFDIPNYSGRVVSTFGQPNFYAGFLLISLPFICFLEVNQMYTSEVDIKRGWKIIAVVSLLLSILAIGISGSRSSQIILFITIFLFIIGYIKSWLKMSIIFITIIIIIIAISFSYRESSGIIFKEYSQLLVDEEWLSKNSPEKRALIWPIIFELIKEKPILGYGLDSLEIVYPKYFERFKPELGQMSAANFTLKNLYLNRSHNYLMDLLLFSGVIGLLGWLGVVGVAIKRTKSKILLSSLLIYLIFIQLQNQSIVHLIQFFLILGLIDSDHQIT